MDLKNIQQLIKFVSKSGVSEVKLETKEFKINIRTTPDGSENNLQTFVTGTPAQGFLPQAQVIPNQGMAPSDAQQNEESTTSEDSNLLTITSPMIGTFYRKPSPDKPVFKNVGDSIIEGDIVCIIEAMKLFNEIESEVSGKIVKVLVEDSSPVEFGQPLFLVERT